MATLSGPSGTCTALGPVCAQVVPSTAVHVRWHSCAAYRPSAARALPCRQHCLGASLEDGKPLAEDSWLMRRIPRYRLSLGCHAPC